jgi:hypothetical protein
MSATLPLPATTAPSTPPHVSGIIDRNVLNIKHIRDTKRKRFLLENRQGSQSRPTSRRCLMNQFEQLSPNIAD